MIEDIQDDDDDENLNPDNQKRIKWYLIDTEKTFCKTWDFMITLITIYELFVVPIIMVFPELYVTCEALPGENQPVGISSKDMKQHAGITDDSICPS